MSLQKSMDVSLVICILILSAFPTHASELWMMPPANNGGQNLRDLLNQPEQWPQTKSFVTVIGYPDHLIDKQFSNDEIAAMMKSLRTLNLKLGLEVGAIKPWGKTAQETFASDRKTWNRIDSLGGSIYAIAMDEPLSACSKNLGLSAEYAVTETAKFVALVRKEFPNILIGDIEPYPSLSAKELISFLDSLQTELRKLNVKGLDFFRLDVDWMEFVESTTPRGSWSEARSVELASRAMHIPFGMIYWAADFPALKNLKMADDATWYVSVLQQGFDYFVVGGRPDQFIIESWIGAPSRMLPETAEWTFTRSVRDFSEHFVRTTASSH